MSSERFLVFAGVCVPEADSAVFASTGKCAPIRAECDAVDIIRMSSERFLMFADMHIPEADSPIVASTGKGVPIWA